MLMLSGVKTIIYIQMVATVMLLCKFGNYILSAPTTGINSARAGAIVLPKSKYQLAGN